MATEFRFEIGDQVKDIVTGFIGVIMARSQYYTGCNDYGLLCPKLDDQGNPKKWEWFDERRLELQGKKRIQLLTSKPSSGPHPYAPMK